MNQLDPVLDQPQSIEVDAADRGALSRLANQDIVFDVDARTDLHNLTWPWANTTYVRSLKLTISDPQHDELMAMVTRHYPGYQETILGSEGMIISKQLCVPLNGAYDRAVLWMLGCQAEGDRLLRLDVEIDWGEALTQRIVDGLLVAQRNPGAARGIYAQHNAESTRVFGNPHGRPTSFEFDDAGHARLSYYVLVNGIIEVPLLLTISDVGEQVAWNGFLALRDAERAFELSVNAWEKAIKTGRLWTPDPELNRAVQQGRLATLRSVQKLRTGLSPVDGVVARLPLLVKALDGCDLIASRNLLAHARRLAERTGGKLPPHFPVRPKDEPEAPGPTLAWNTSAYLQALADHLKRHPDADLLADHYAAVQTCAETLIQLRIEAQQQIDAPAFAAAGVGLRQAVILATQNGNSADAVRWESEACELERMAEQAGNTPPAAQPLTLQNWRNTAGWHFTQDRPWHFDDDWAGVALAGEAIWNGYGVQRRRGGKLWVYPKRAAGWSWWALLDLPIDGGSLSLVWDGTTLHATQPVQSDQPVKLYRRIRALNTDELDFDLRFEMTPADEDGGMAARQHFHPIFQQGIVQPSGS